MVAVKGRGGSIIGADVCLIQHSLDLDESLDLLPNRGMVGAVGHELRIGVVDVAGVAAGARKILQVE